MKLNYNNSHKYFFNKVLDFNYAKLKYFNKSSNYSSCYLFRCMLHKFCKYEKTYLKSHIENLAIEKQSCNIIILKNEDEHVNEYLKEESKIIKKLSNFTGSYAISIITNESNMLFTDSRYHIQASKELYSNWKFLDISKFKDYLLNVLNSNINNKPVNIYLNENKMSYGFYINTLKPICKIVEEKNSKLTNKNIINFKSLDLKEQSEININSSYNIDKNVFKDIIVLNDIKISGQDTIDKLDNLDKYIKKYCLDKHQTNYILIDNKLDNIAWLINARYLNEIENNPVFYSYITIFSQINNNKGVVDLVLNLYIKENHHNIIKSYLKDLLTNNYNKLKDLKYNIKFNVYNYYNYEKSFITDLLREIESTSNINTIIYPNSINIHLQKIINNNFSNIKTFKVEQIQNFNFTAIESLKSVKNKNEIENIKKAHILDGICIIKYIAWLENMVNKNVKVSEFEAANKLYQIRKKNFNKKKSFDINAVLNNNNKNIDIDLCNLNLDNPFMMQSFDTISSYAENSAIVHYKPTQYNSKIIKNDNIYLLDTGGHYIYGTTDTTRTFTFNKHYNILQKQKEIYTRVLLGNLALERSVINIGKSNKNDFANLDTLARQYLRQINLDYGHGTGHGVGCFLNVHEGPFNVSPNCKMNIQEGYTFSNEPGCYIENEFGVRIENILIAKKLNVCDDYNFDNLYYNDSKKELNSNRKFDNNIDNNNNNIIYFENVTRFPYETNLIDFDLLSKKDIKFINKYHSYIKEELNIYFNYILKNNYLLNVIDTEEIDLIKLGQEYLFRKTENIII